MKSQVLLNSPFLPEKVRYFLPPDPLPVRSRLLNKHKEQTNQSCLYSLWSGGKKNLTLEPEGNFPSVKKRVSSEISLLPNLAGNRVCWALPMDLWVAERLPPKPTPEQGGQWAEPTEGKGAFWTVNSLMLLLLVLASVSSHTLCVLVSRYLFLSVWDFQRNQTRTLRDHFT